MNIFVIIVTYNPKQWIDKCLGSLKESLCFVRTIVVDNNSTDGSKDYIRKNFPEVILLENTLNLGFGKANNIGIKKAYESGADYVFLLNQDAWVNHDTIKDLVQAHQKEPDFGIVSPMHLNGKGTAFDYNFSNYINPAKCKNLYSDIFLNTIKKKIYKIEFVNAAAWLISKKCIEVVGGFNPSFFHYGEDNNYLQRVEFHQFKIGVCPNSIVYHDRETNSENSYFINQEKFYIRNVVLKVSNPTNKYSFEKEYKKSYIFLCKALFSFRLKKIKEVLCKIKALNHLDRKQIINNRIESCKPQSSFLNL